MIFRSNESCQKRDFLKIAGEFDGGLKKQKDFRDPEIQVGVRALGSKLAVSGPDMAEAAGS